MVTARFGGREIIYDNPLENFSDGLSTSLKFHSGWNYFPVLTRVTPSISSSSIILTKLNFFTFSKAQSEKTRRVYLWKLNLFVLDFVLLCFTLHLFIHVSSRKSLETEKNHVNRIIGFNHSAKIPLKIEAWLVATFYDSSWFPFHSTTRDFFSLILFHTLCCFALEVSVSKKTKM